jgi:hypothetical protein
MNETPKEAPRPSALDSSRWIYRIVIAVVLGEAIWSFLVSVTDDLILPAITRVAGGVQFDFKIPKFFVSIIELCLAIIVASVLSWFRRTLRTNYKPAKRTPEIPPHPAPSTSPSATPTIVAPAPTSTAKAAAAASAATAAIALNVPTSAPPSSTPPAKPAKPKREKQVYYNIVGEPMDTDE